MSATHCLNCNAPLLGTYCHGCGQKGDTHRLSMKHFIAHDLVHGLFHLDGSFPRALKNTLLRPGITARAYIAGRREGQFNLVTLLLILAGLTFFVSRGLIEDSFKKSLLVRQNDVGRDSATVTVPGREPGTWETTTTRKREALTDGLDSLWANGKWFTLATIPLLALASLIVWRRARYNYAEHIVVSSFFLAGFLIVNLVTTVIDWRLGQWTGRKIDVTSSVLTLLFFGFAYWQAHRTRYTLGVALACTNALVALFRSHRSVDSSHCLPSLKRREVCYQKRLAIRTAMKEIANMPIPGALLLTLPAHPDERGLFVKTFHESTLREAGIHFPLAESYFSFSRNGVIRGMHFQTPPHAHAKIVFCPVGAIRDVVLDLRKESQTFGRHFSQELSAENHQALYIPPGCAHGFEALTNGAMTYYLVSSEYSREHDAGVRWDSFGMEWGTNAPILSARDAGFPALADFASPF